MDDVKEMRTSQQNKCAICYIEFLSDGQKSKSVIDHCHSSGKNRALLCWTCNVALGLIKDNPVIAQNMVNYLEKHQ